jgi:thioredoxin reductase (NADPH)
VGNWPGDIEVKGPELMERMKKHAVSYKEVTHKNGKIDRIEKTKTGFKLTYQGGGADEARAVIFATGSKKRHLGVPGEEKFAGRGVSYCATCDAFFFKGKTVAVVGGGDAAIEGAAIVAQVVRQVYLIHRRKEYRAEPYWVQKLKERRNVTFVLERKVKEIVGDAKVTGLVLDTPFEGSDRLAVDGVFVEVGADQQTSVPGAFAAGDVSSGSNHFAQFVTAAGEGAVAVSGVFAFLQGGGA